MDANSGKEEIANESASCYAIIRKNVTCQFTLHTETAFLKWCFFHNNYAIISYNNMCIAKESCMSLGKNIQYLRKQKKITQEQLAEIMSVSRQTISRWEADEIIPELNKLIS